MRTEIRRASGDDAQRVAAFFTSLYETRHGIGSAASLEMLQRTVASLFADDDSVTVFISERDGVVEGVTAVRHGEGEGTCELVAIQADDTIRGRGVAQTLLSHLVENCAVQGSTSLTTVVTSADVRARGFLRREGFMVSAEEFGTGAQAVDAVVTYTLDVVKARSRVTLPDRDEVIEPMTGAETESPDA